MENWFHGLKLDVLLAALIGGICAIPFVQMVLKNRVLALLFGMVMAFFVAVPLAAWVGLEREAAAFLVGLFGKPICQLIFDSIRKSDLSLKVQDIIELIRIRKG